MSAFHDAARFTKEAEGGWYDGSEDRDPNPTMWGVTQKRYDEYRDEVGLPRQSVRHITYTEWRDIYATYWSRAHGDDLPYRTAATVVDMAFNAGPKAAIRCLQRAMGVLDDGIWGPITESAVDGARLYDLELAQATNWERVREYRAIVRRKPVKLPNLPGWLKRALDFYDEFLMER